MKKNIIVDAIRRLIPGGELQVDHNWYNIEYPDVAAAGIDPSVHYKNHGSMEGRHPAFDPEWYLAEYEDVAKAGLDPLNHYLHHGRHEGRHPSFDPRWYLEEYDDVRQSGMDPLKHYRRFGRQEGRHPAFDRRFYNANYPEVPAAGIEAYSHYLHHGRSESRHPGFQRGWYLAEYPDVAAAGVDPYRHFFLAGKREGRHPGFDRRWYLSEYPDVVGYGMDLLDHYNRYGKFEGRYPAFSRTWYTNEYPDVETSGLDAYKHYVTTGKSQGRRPSLPGGATTPYRIPMGLKAAAYSAHYEPNRTFLDATTDIKALTFYLPQFHESEHNNRFWGQGFTEWVNTKKSTPRFPGHYQPRVPHADLGYYDLADPAVLKAQAELARSHGIYGFCFYHYWFSGERVLEKPVDLLLENPSIDINFMLCWANENWTRTWDGQERNVLLEQNYAADDPDRFIRDIERYLLDKRYIRLNGSPVVLVYKAHLIPNFVQVVEIWKAYWLAKHSEELIVWINRTDPSDHAGFNTPAVVDGVVEFPPNHLPATRHAFPYLMESTYLYPDQSVDGNLFDYNQMVDDIVSGRELSPPPIDKPFYRSTTLGWDNSARRSEGWSVWHGFSLEKYYQWLRKTIQDTRIRHGVDERFVFINAWNEWAEGTYLEPDERYGYASINTTSKALFGLPYEDSLEVIEPTKPRHGPKVAVHLHVFYESLVEEFARELAHIPLSFDIFVTADSTEKLEAAKLHLEKIRNIGRSEFHLVPNIGRDIGPLLQLGERLLKYDLFAHLHTKRSTTVNWGDAWRRYLLNHLLGSEENISAIFARFEGDGSLGFYYPENYPLIKPHINWGGTKGRCEDILQKADAHVELPEHPSFAAGSFFWARPAALLPILKKEWPLESFEREAGQVQSTLAHCVERLWVYVAASTGYSSASYISKNAFSAQKANVLGGTKKRLSLFVHYSADNDFSQADRYYLENLRKVSDRLVLIQNVEKPIQSKRNVDLADETYIRWNRGYDFAAWRDALYKIGRSNVQQYDEIIFANNSCYGPLYPFDDVLGKADPNVDFWGITGFPSSPDSPRPEAGLLPSRFIPEHLQSYFFVVRDKLHKSETFWDFWAAVFDNENLMDVVAFQEAQMTRKFADGGFSYQILVPESMELQRSQAHDPRYNAPYNSPLAMLLLGSPLIKKKARGYAPEETRTTEELINKLGLLPNDLFGSTKIG